MVGSLCSADSRSNVDGSIDCNTVIPSGPLGDCCLRVVDCLVFPLARRVRRAISVPTGRCGTRNSSAATGVANPNKGRAISAAWLRWLGTDADEEPRLSMALAGCANPPDFGPGCRGRLSGISLGADTAASGTYRHYILD